MEISIRLTEQERQLADNYARLHSLTLAEAFKQALFEKIEDEYYLKLYDEAYAEYEKNSTTYSLDEMRKKLGL